MGGKRRKFTDTFQAQVALEALLIPCSRQKSGTGAPLSPCFRIAKICA
jgi:hypothetical protein